MPDLTLKTNDSRRPSPAFLLRSTSTNSYADKVKAKELLEKAIAKLT
jgi:hypothetical protein